MHGGLFYLDLSNNLLSDKKLTNKILCRLTSFFSHLFQHNLRAARELINLENSEFDFLCHEIQRWCGGGGAAKRGAVAILQ